MEEQAEEQPKAPAKELGMKWYKYVINFALFASAIWNVIVAVLHFGGFIYDGMSDIVYAVYPNLLTLDIVYGVVCIIMAVLAIVARFLLAKFKKSGITCLYVLYAIVIVIFFVYYIAAANILEVDLADVLESNEVAMVIASAVMLVVNIVYFTKRRHMFN